MSKMIPKRNSKMIHIFKYYYDNTSHALRIPVRAAVIINRHLPHRYSSLLSYEYSYSSQLALQAFKEHSRFDLKTLSSWPFSSTVTFHVSSKYLFRQSTFIHLVQMPKSPQHILIYFCNYILFQTTSLTRHCVLRTVIYPRLTYVSEGPDYIKPQ